MSEDARAAVVETNEAVEEQAPAPLAAGRAARRGRGRRNRELPDGLPVLPLINTVVFPRMTVPLLVDVPASITALREAEARGPLILLLAQRSEDLKTVGPDDLFGVGTVAQIMQSIRVPDGGMQVVVQGIARAKVLGCDLAATSLAVLGAGVAVGPNEGRPGLPPPDAPTPPVESAEEGAEEGVV